MVLAHDLRQSQKTKDIQISEDITFDTMLFSANTSEGLKTAGFVRPSPIQLHGIPLGKCGFDLLLEAKSGTGKTAVFTVIALEQLDLKKGLQTIVLAPTREIAAQICDVFRQIGCKYKGLCIEVVIGGLPLNEDIEKFNGKKVHIVVGCPGRLKHLINDGHLDISAVRLIVFDEADKLMEKSFLADIKYIYLAVPKDKQVIMSSATYPEECKQFINEFVYDAQHICPNSDCVLLGVAQKITHVKHSSNTVVQTTKRFKELLKIITTKQFKQCLIFCNYRARVREVYKMLVREKWPTEQLYGAQDQIHRLDALKTLQDYKCRILISTDLAARGIDASNVDLVVNFEPPIDWQTYLHRIGRAGRFGSYGMAITILSEGVEQKNFMNLLDTANLAANVSPLWIEAESINSDTEIIKVSETQDSVKLNGSNDLLEYAELWNIICDTEITSNKRVVEDFHELLHSFQSTTDNTDGIKSFSDLYESFQNDHLSDTADGTEYKCMKLSSVMNQSLIGITKKIKDLIESDVLEINNAPYIVSSNVNNINIEETNDSLEKLSINQEVNKKQEKNYSSDKLSNNIIGNKEKTNDLTDKFNNSVNSIKEKRNNSSDKSCNRSAEKKGSTNKISINKKKQRKTEKQRTSDELGKNINKSEDKTNDSTDKLSNNFHDTNENTFAKSNKPPVLYTEDDDSEGNYMPTCNSSFSNNNIHSKFKVKSSAKMRSVMRSSRETSCSSSTEDIHIMTKNSNRKTHSKVKNTHINSQSKLNCYPHCSTSKTQSKVNPNKKHVSVNKYNNWYNELQIRVKQIELAIYIDELSKL